jgi:hypothetical protein
MRIAFYAPLKSPNHPVPSGDRQMARNLIAALELAGHRVDLISELRAYLPEPQDLPGYALLRRHAEAERRRIATLWQQQGVPDLWFCYHPYYKSPDLLGPELCRQFGRAWISAEASLSARRDQGIWAETQSQMREAVNLAAVNFTMTGRDQAGLRMHAPGARLAGLAPFIELPLQPAANLEGNLLVCVAMMRAGDKWQSYQALAAALAGLPRDCGWRLAVAGDGKEMTAVQALFPPGRVDWRGRLSPAGVRDLLAEAAVYVWPGCGEAYGLAYLEAQAAGLPVVAWATAGVPEVVRHGDGGVLAAEGDIAGLTAGIARLLAEPQFRREMGRAAAARVHREHGRAAAARRLDRELVRACDQIWRG